MQDKNPHFSPSSCPAQPPLMCLPLAVKTSPTVTCPLGCHRAKAHHRHSHPYPALQLTAVPGSQSLDSLKGQTHLAGQVIRVGYKGGFFILGEKLLEVPSKIEPMPASS